MKQYLTALFILASISARSQQDTTAYNRLFPHSVYERHSVQATISLGFIDGYRNNYTVPVDFKKNNTSGYANISAKIDYALSRRISLAASFGYDAFVYNISQLFQGNNGPVIRYKDNKLKVFNLGLIAYYHLGNVIHVKRLDPFAGLGLSLNNIGYSAYPQGDSTLSRSTHTVTPYIKVGGRYYMSDKFSLFADAGYEKQSIFSLGFSCRFFAKNTLPK